MEFKKKIETQYQEFKSNPIEGGMKWVWVPYDKFQPNWNTTIKQKKVNISSKSNELVQNLRPNSYIKLNSKSVVFNTIVTFLV
jgi:hypothetical protein